MERVRHLTLSGLLVLFLLLSGRANAQDSIQLRQMISILSSDSLYGRGACYDGERRAAEWIRRTLSDIPHTLPMFENGFQKYTFKGFKMEGAIHLRIDGVTYSPFTEYRIDPCAQTTHVTQMPIVKVDASLLVDPARLERFIAKHREELKQSAIYIDAVEWKQQSKLDEKSVKRAIDLLHFQSPFPSSVLLLGVDALPISGLGSNHFERDYALVSVMRKTITKKSRSISLSFNNQFIKKETQNVCFAIDGQRYPDQFVVFTAHYDHLGCMGDSLIFHGAHDNASGVAAVIDFAKYYSQNPPDYTTVFLLCSGEESGLRGSKQFTKYPSIPLDKIKMVINMDMFCGGDEGIMVVNAYDSKTKPFVDIMDTINLKNSYVKDIKRRNNTQNSDHYHFSLHAPAIFIYTMGGRYGGYHDYTDTCDNCGLSHYSRIFYLIRDALDTYLKQ